MARLHCAQKSLELCGSITIAGELIQGTGLSLQPTSALRQCNLLFHSATLAPRLSCILGHSSDLLHRLSSGVFGQRFPVTVLAPPSSPPPPSMLLHEVLHWKIVVFPRRLLPLNSAYRTAFAADKTGGARTSFLCFNYHVFQFEVYGNPPLIYPQAQL